MADQNSNWLSDSLSAAPGILNGVSNIMYAEKGIPNGPVTYVQATQPATGYGFGGGNTLLYAGLAVAAVVLIIVLAKK